MAAALQVPEHKVWKRWEASTVQLSFSHSHFVVWVSLFFALLKPGTANIIFSQVFVD